MKKEWGSRAVPHLLGKKRQSGRRNRCTHHETLRLFPESLRCSLIHRFPRAGMIQRLEVKGDF
uniref:Uncharacterized protein n=1 Tax=Acanthochromis polyacanthus TaxID=80966 RepID=A0A3Q1FYG4_9TELE